MKLVDSEYSPDTGITTEYWAWEENGLGKLTIRRLQDTNEILKSNKEEFNSHADKATFSDVKNGLFKAAEIPFVVLEQWMSEGFNWYEATPSERRAKLNDSNFKKLRTRPGKL